jgi:hypothetical protein
VYEISVADPGWGKVRIRDEDYQDLRSGINNAGSATLVFTFGKKLLMTKLYV